MKWIISVLLLLCGLNSFARRFFVGAGGDNNASGLTIGLRWLNLNKVNAVNLVAGDSVLFAGGEVFFGRFTPTASSNGFTISTYGSGKATFSALTTLTSWSNISGQLWECTPSQTLKANCNVLTINGYPQAVGRTPNTGSYLIYQTANTTTLTSNALTGTPNYTGAEVCFKNNGYSATKGAITGQSGSTLTYTQTQAIDNNNPLTSSPIMPTGGNFGFFLQRFAGSLDAQWEWYFNPATNKMRLYSTVNPSTLTVKASYQDTLFFLGNHTGINITNVAFEGAGMYAIETYNGANIRIDSCVFTNNTRPIYAWGPLNMTVDSCTFRHSFVNFLMINGSSNRYPKQITITNNNADSTGELLGMGLYWSDFNLKGMFARVDVTTTANFLNIIGNTVRHTGYSGIQFQGSNVTVRRNVVDSFLGGLQDGGGIYSFTNNQTLNTINYINRNVDSNFISNARSGAWGVGADVSPDVAGYYLDDQATNISGIHNTIWNIPSFVNTTGTGVAIQMNTPHDNIFTDNTIYNANFFMDLNKRHVAEVYNNRITKNVMYQKQNTLQLYFFHVDDNLTLPTPHTIQAGIQNIAFIDSNWISNSLANGYKYYYSATGSGTTGPIFFNYAAWQGTYIHDVHGVLPPITVTNTNTTLWTNPSSNLRVVNFAGFRKIDPKGVIYDNQATISRWSSLILIDDGNSPQSGNIPPVARAGTDVTITLPTNSTSLSGSGSTDADGTIVAYLWTKISGPASGTITTPNSVNTTLTSLTQGTYNFRLKVTDNIGDTSVDFVQVQVNAAPIPPVANAGADQTVQLPTNSTTVSGGGSSDADGTITTYLWAKISGPSGGTITSPNNIVTTITNMVAGVYVFSLTVTDNSGLSNTDFMQITVNAIVPPVNQPPVSNAGADQVITLPTSTATLNGTGSTDPDGTITGYLWRKISGPSGGAITASTNATTGVTGLIAGTYIYQLRVTDNSGDTSIDAMRITVNAQNIPPSVNAGADQTFALPTNSTTLNGTATDVDGTISSVLWTKISGPTGGTITSSTSLSTTITGLNAGQYIYNLRATDNSGDTAVDAIQITVNPAPPLIAPVADAGIGQTITTPTSSTTLNGSATDADGTISSYGWAQVSGPNSATITPNNTASTVVSNLIVGTYLFKLTATDNDGLIGRDTVQIDVVAPVNTPPVASAGGNFTTSNTTITLNGSGSDIGGSIVSYHWVTISAPAGSAEVFSDANIAVPTVSNLIIGVYQFQLTVTDNGSLTATDTATVTITSVDNGNWLLRFYKILP